MGLTFKSTKHCAKNIMFEKGERSSWKALLYVPNFKYLSLYFCAQPGWDPGTQHLARSRLLEAQINVNLFLLEDTVSQLWLYSALCLAKPVLLNKFRL